MIKKHRQIKNNLTPLFIVLALTCFFLSPLSAQAAGGGTIGLVGQIFGIIDQYSQGWLDALDFIDNSVMTILVWLALITVLSAGFLIFSAAFLDWASSSPINLTSAANPLVHQGWDFAVGLVNVLFILILVIIAFSYIFKLETWGMKKALPRLIIVALLMNFSLLFVQMFVDFGWVAQNSFKNAFFENGKMAQTVIDPIKTGLADTLGKQGTQLTGYALSGLIPFKAAMKLIKFLSLVAGEAFLGTYSQTILLIILSLVGGFVFFVYGILFLVRIVVVWLLAILAPLAFAAFILPKTRKYFDQWLKALFQWMFFGIAAFFFMGIGIKLYAIVAPAKFFQLSFGSTSWGLVESYSKFIFLIIYLGVVLIFTKKLLPKGAEVVWKAFAAASTAVGMTGGIAALKGARGITREGYERPLGTYQYLREGGMGRREAFTEAARRSLLKTRQALWPMRRMGVGPRIARIAGATGVSGILRAARDVATKGARAGLETGLGIKLRKKGLRKKPCQACGFGSVPSEKIAASADRCPRCRYVF